MSTIDAAATGSEERAMSVDSTRATIAAYLEALVGGGQYGAYLAPDAILTLMDSGEVTRGRDAIVGMLDFMHTRAFAAKLDITSLVVDEGRTMVEAVLAGVHTGEFAGVAPTGRAVRVPYVAAYDVAGDLITALRVYLPVETLVRQLRAARPPSARDG